MSGGRFLVLALPEECSVNRLLLAEILGFNQSDLSRRLPERAFSFLVVVCCLDAVSIEWSGMPITTQSFNQESQVALWSLKLSGYFLCLVLQIYNMRFLSWLDNLRVRLQCMMTGVNKKEKNKWRVFFTPKK